MKIKTVQNLIDYLKQLSPNWPIGIMVYDGKHTIVHQKNIRVGTFIGVGKGKGNSGYVIMSDNL